MVINFTQIDDKQNGFADTLAFLEEKACMSYEISNPNKLWCNLSRDEQYALMETAFSRHIKSVEVIETGIIAAYEKAIQELQEENEKLRTIWTKVIENLKGSIPEPKGMKLDQIAIEE